MEVGEVITYFEGVAEGLFKTIDAIEKRLEDLSKKTYEININTTGDFLPTAEIVAAIKNIESRLDAFAARIDAFADKIVSTGKRVSQRVQNVAANSVDAVAEHASFTFETLLARSIAIAIGVSAVQKFFVPLSNAGFRFLKVFGKAAYLEAKGLFDFLVFKAKSFAYAWQTLLSFTTNTSIPYFVEILQRLVQVLPFLSGSSLFFLIPFLLGQALSLLRKIRGEGKSSLTLVEKISSIVDFIYKSINLSFNTLYKGVALVGGAIATYFLPLWGRIVAMPALINTITGGLVNTLNWVSNYTLSMLGSGKATLSLLIHDVKQFGRYVLPMINSWGKALNEARKNAKDFNIVAIIVRLQTYLRGVLKQLIEIAEILKTVFRDSLKGAGDVGGQVTSSLQKIDKGITAQMTRLGKGFWTRARQVPFFRKPQPGIDVYIDTKKELQKKTEQESAIIKKKEKVLVDAAGREMRAQQQAAQITETTSRKAIQAEQKRTAALKQETPLLKANLVYLLELAKADLFAGKSAFEHSRRLRSLLESLGALTENIIKAGKATTEQQQRMSKFFKNIAKEINRLGKEIGKDFTPLTKNLISAVEKGLKFDVSKIKSAFAPVEKHLSQMVEKGLIKGKTAGGKIASMLSKGMRENKTEAAVGAAKLAETIAAYYPQSPAKVGPLVNLVKMGALIPAYLAQGIAGAAAIAVVTAAVGRIARLITNTFTSVFGEIRRAGQAIAGFISKPLEDAAALQKLSERTGIAVEHLSSLDYVAKSVNSSVGELEYTFSALQSILTKTLTPAEERKFRDLGIDLDQIRKAQDPTLAFFYAISEALKELPRGGAKFRETLELVGITAQSQGVNVLLMGDKIKDMQKEAIETGAVVSSRMAETSKNVLSIYNRLKALKERLLDTLIEQLLPELIEKGERLLNTLKNYMPEIKAIGDYTGKVIAQLMRTVKAFILLLVNDPEMALKGLWTIIKETVNLVGKTVTSLFLKMGPYVGDSIGNLFGIAYNIIKKLIGVLWDNVLSWTWQGMVGFSAWWMEASGRFLSKIYNAMKSLTWAEIKNFLVDFANNIVNWFDGLDNKSKVALSILFPPLFPGIQTLKAAGFKRETADISKVTAELEAEAIKAEKSVSPFADAIKQGIEDSKAEIKGLKDAAEGLRNALTDPENFEQAKENAIKAAENVKMAFAGTELEAEIQKLLDLFSKEAWQESLSRIEDVEAKALDALNNIENEAEDATNKLGIGIEGTSDFEGMMERLKAQKKSIVDAQKADEERLAKVRELNESVIGGLGQGLEDVIKTVAEKGRFTMEDLASLGSSIFQQSFEKTIENLRGGFEKMITKSLDALGAGSEVVAGALQGAFAVAALLMSRMSSKAEVVNSQIQETVEKTEQLRGVIAGETTVGIQEVATKLITANQPVVLRLDRVIDVLTQIRDHVSGNATAAPTAVSLGMLESFS